MITPVTAYQDVCVMVFLGSPDLSRRVFQSAAISVGGLALSVWVTRLLGFVCFRPIGVNADSGWGFPKPRKCESMAAYLGGRSDGCSNRITVGF